MTTTESFMDADRLLPLFPEELREELTRITDAHPDYMPRVTFSSEWTPGEIEDREHWNIVTMFWERDKVTLNIWASRRGWSAKIENRPLGLQGAETIASEVEHIFSIISDLKGIYR